MKHSPFIFGSTVSGQGFTDREAESAKLISNLLSGINTVIVSPRRWGKSSLVERVLSEIRMQESNTRTVLIDLYTVGSEEEFLEVFAREVIKASSGKWKEWMEIGRSFLKKIVPRFQVGIDPQTDFSISFDWKELQKNADEILSLPELVAQKKGIKLIICLDEFQQMASFPGFENLEKKARAIWQRQKLVTYCLYGSKRHMMTDIFNNPSKPFYRFGDIMILPKIGTNHWIRFITESFSKSGKIISEDHARQLAESMKNHAWYVQQLAHYTWNLTQKKAGLAEMDKALKELVNANTPLFEKEVDILSATQLNLLKAVAAGETRFTSSSVMSDYRLGTPRNVSKNKMILLEKDLIHDDLEGTEFLDPAFELWFRKRYFNQPYGYLF